MALVNVRRDVSDAFYRYKMERLQTKIEGKGNGIKTVVVNLSSVAASLARPGAYVIKYFGFELGAQTNIDPKDDRWIINGAHDAPKLQDHLDGFINKFVLCKKCKNPETDVVIKDDHILLDCKACGQRTDVDLRLKLSGFILKNQPKKGKKDKAERRAAKKARQNGNAANGTNGQNGAGSDEASENGSNENGDEDVGSDDEFQKVQAEAAEVAQENEVKEHEWAVDMSEEAVKARQASLPGEFKQKLNIGDDDEEEGDGGPTVYDELGDWIQSQAEEKGNIDKVESIDIYVKAKELGIENKHRTVLVLVQTIFDKNIVAQISKRASMLKQFVTSERHEKALLGGTERLVGRLAADQPEMFQSIVKILQLYYHHDLVSEEVVTKWGSKASKKYTDISTSKKVRKAAEPFLTWLAEADSEESSDEE
ncbi:domain found in IF2B/IF5-domain-containing protein [Fusarium flagelliforme]|jgi:translation initiation factor 5|uniref:Translation initiation factor 5 n=1 Tax=Fusarium flagelliforme TaxID=2675880 RepID=A0A395M9L9_9HYPO|nr:domain found in IF2B/IF5-domain-containing protein [Fusarium flagelliforme]KAH7182845.1 domain found in IF2B/IF5-domain-containing protein [Fusarium flagelliforme]RFN44565.1 translation initiation factor 5 [Fusarium flagelliforme]